jgi:predicted metal-binding membrane protein
MAMGPGMPMPGGWVMSMTWMRMPAQSWAGAAAMFGAMWAVMMVAMMMPAVARVLVRHRRPLRVAVAYHAIWFAVGAAIYPLGALLAAATMRWTALSRAMPYAIAATIVVAGVLQLSHRKARALERCRDPACCALGRRPGPRQAWIDGARLGRHCVTCCGPLMLALLAAGVMDVAPMTAATLAITAERVLPRPRLVARAIGVALIVAGVGYGAWS